MALYFNDLTLDKVPQQNAMLFREFWKVMKRFSQATEGREKRVIANDTGLNAAADALASSPEQMMFFGSFFAKPYEDESAQKKLAAAEDHANETEYRLAEDDGGLDCPMMGRAHQDRSLTIGLSSSRRWNELVYLIERTALEEGDNGLEEVRARVESVCVTKVEQIDDSRIQSWIAAQRDFAEVPDPVPCALAPEDKHIKVQTHHGIDVLNQFARQLCQYRYVQGVIDSIAWKSGSHEFVDKCYDDGVVDVRLHWTSRGYGLKLQTTAKGVLQTRKVAEMLKAKFDRKS